MALPNAGSDASEAVSPLFQSFRCCSDPMRAMFRMLSNRAFETIPHAVECLCFGAARRPFKRGLARR
eukprot:3004845-Lingulodinium_polyedra.AAC.1